MTPVSHQRLHNQQITQHAFSRPEEVVRYMGAMQAQDYEMSKWAVGARLRNATDEMVETALNEGRIIRTHILRPTWHLVAAEDIRWMLDLTASHVMRLNASMDRKLGLDESIYHKSNTIIEKALATHRCLTRDEVMVHLQEKGFNIADNRPAHYMFYAELTQLVCSGPRKGKQLTYMLMDERVPSGVKKSREEALAELALRYFTSHGPATVKDFSWWSGLNQTDIKKGIAACGKALFCETINEKAYWTAGNQTVEPQSAIFALPAFDEFTVSYADRSPTVDPAIAQLAMTSNGIFKPIIIHNGELTGVWKRTVKPAKVVIEVDFCKNPVREKLPAAFETYAAFMNKPVEIL